MNVDTKRLKSRLDTLKKEHEEWVPIWRKIARYFQPKALETFDEIRSGQVSRPQNVISNLGEVEAETLANSLISILTAVSGRWFSLATKEGKTNEELDKLSDLIMEAISDPTAQFPSRLQTAMTDLVVFGTACIYVAPDWKKKKVYYGTHPVGQLRIAENPQGLVDEVFRSLEMTAKQCKEKFGEENLPDQIKKQANDERRQNQKVEIYHCIVPDPLNYLTDAGAKIKETEDDGQKYLSVWMTEQETPDKRQPHALRIGTYDRPPVAVIRWTQTTGASYGRSPALKALASVERLQELLTRMWEMAHKAVDPPLAVSSDIEPDKINLQPGAINFMPVELMLRSGASGMIAPIMSGSNYAPPEGMVAMLAGEIKEHFFAKWRVVERPPQMTATQFLEQLAESMRMLAPYFNKVIGELLNPVIIGTLEALTKLGIVSLPDETGFEDLKVIYNSPYVKQQDLAEAQSLVRFADIAAALAQPIPMLDWLKEKEIIKIVVNGLGVPTTAVENPQAVQKAREERDKMRKAQELANIGQTASDAAAKMAAAGKSNGGAAGPGGTSGG